MAAPLQPTNISKDELFDKVENCFFCRDTDYIIRNFPKLDLYNTPCCVHCIKLTICSFCDNDTDILDLPCSECSRKLKTPKVKSFSHYTKIEKKK